VELEGKHRQQLLINVVVEGIKQILRWRFTFRSEAKSAISFQSTAFKKYWFISYIKFVSRDGGTHNLGIVTVFIRIEAIIFIYL